MDAGVLGDQTNMSPRLITIKGWNQVGRGGEGGGTVRVWELSTKTNIRGGRQSL